MEQNRDVQKLQYLDRALKKSIENLEISQRKVQECMEKEVNHQLPSEQNSPYKNDGLLLEDVLNPKASLKEFMDEFMEICTRISHIGLNSTISGVNRVVFKLIAIRRAFDAEIPILKRAL